MPVMTRTGAPLTAAAEKLRDLAAEQAPAAEASRRLTPDVVDMLREAGFARHFVAACWGGEEGNFEDLVHALITIGAGCASTAWCASLCTASTRFASHLPQQGHEEIWGDGPDVFIATALIPSGETVPAKGGWRLTGAWPYVSAIDFADWVLVCALASDGGQPERRFFALPRGAFTIQPSWDSVGMCATGSHTVLADDVFVAEHLSFVRADMEAGRNSTSPLPCHNLPYASYGGLTFVVPAVGAAGGALAACAGVLARKRHRAQSDLEEFVRASGRIDSAHVLVTQNADVIDTRSFTEKLLARSQRNACFSAELAVEAVGQLIRVAGTGGLSESGPLQRHWRDVISATSHIALRYDVTRAAENYSSVLMSGA
jgi:alkylation response protein AidB-like acyl-CoA dehydrogenase